MVAKRADYFAAGTLVVWDVDLLSSDVVRVYRSTAPTRRRSTAVAILRKRSPPCRGGGCRWMNFSRSERTSGPLRLGVAGQSHVAAPVASSLARYAGRRERIRRLPAKRAGRVISEPGVQAISNTRCSPTRFTKGIPFSLIFSASRSLVGRCRIAGELASIFQFWAYEQLHTRRD